MKKKTKILVLVAMPLWITWSLSCASSALHLIPALENRTLRISEESPALEYQYEVCTKKILGVCSKREMRKDTYDLRDSEVRMQLIHMGFVVKIREKL